MQTQNSPSSIQGFLIAQDPQGDGSVGLPIDLPFRIGRMEGFDLCLECPSVSALHAEILEEEGGLWIYDLESTNGTYVNGERVDEKRLLSDEDTILLGSRTFRFLLKDCKTPDNGQATEAEDGDGDTTVLNETQEQQFQHLLDNAVPFFQPVYEIANAQHRLVGFEVFGRSSVSGLRTPDKMFAAALSLSMESELSRFFRQLGIEVAQDKVPNWMKLFVNTHPAELNRNNLEDSLRELRDAFPDRPIVLELSAAYLIEPSSISPLRKLLKSLEIELALDNFGIGQLPIAELNEISPDYVKFDSALTNEINGATPKHQRLVRGLVKMVKEFGITPMAEAVESLEEHQTLTQLGFEFAQGFHYGRPHDIDKIELPVPEQTPSASAFASSKAGQSNLRPVDLAKEIESSSQSPEVTKDNRREIASEGAKTVKDSQWLMQQQDDHYTIQLTMSQSRRSAEQFVSQQKLPGDYAWYHRPGRTKSWFIVLCGSFESRENAKRQAERFKEVGVMPLVRRLSAIQNEVLKNQRTEADTKNV